MEGKYVSLLEKIKPRNLLDHIPYLLLVPPQILKTVPIFGERVDCLGNF